MTPAGKLVRAFGDVDRMAEMYAPQICWSLSASLVMYARPMRGREEVTAFNRHVWGEVYHPNCHVEILDEAGNDTSSAVRFIYSATLRSNGQLYKNEYTLFARKSSQGITDVFEGLDTAILLDFVSERKAGSAFEQIGVERHVSRNEH